MMRYKKLEHRFVKFMPEQLEPGVLYISLEFATSSHSCCCGCGEEVVIPFSPVRWKMVFDGESVSIFPSVGSWTLHCRSHYVIDRGSVVTALPWTESQIAAGMQREKAERERYYGAPPAVGVPQTPVEAPAPPPTLPAKPIGWWTRFWRWVSGVS